MNRALIVIIHEAHGFNIVDELTFESVCTTASPKSGLMAKALSDHVVVQFGAIVCTTARPSELCVYNYPVALAQRRLIRGMKT